MHSVDHQKGRTATPDVLKMVSPTSPITWSLCVSMITACRIAPPER